MPIFNQNSQFDFLHLILKYFIHVPAFEREHIQGEGETKTNKKHSMSLQRRMHHEQKRTVYGEMYPEL